jgi:AcrR family transcriptional regulator
MSMDVKGSVTSKRVAQGETTKAALVTAARELFGANGYARTSLDGIVAAAGVTKGAVYHHFSDKEGLFQAVFERVELEVSDQAVVAFLQPDSWEALVAGCVLWVQAHLDPEVRTIVLQDAQAVLGLSTTRAIQNRYSAVAVRGGLRKAMTAGVIERQPLQALALMITGALSEACVYVTEAADQEVALEEVRALIQALLSGLRTPDGS